MNDLFAGPSEDELHVRRIAARNLKEFYDAEGNEITLMEGLKLFTDRKYKQIKYTEFSTGLRISTVWSLFESREGPVFETGLLYKGQCTILEIANSKEEALRDHIHHAGLHLYHLGRLIIEEYYATNSYNLSRNSRKRKNNGI